MKICIEMLFKPKRPFIPANLFLNQMKSTRSGSINYNPLIGTKYSIEGIKITINEKISDCRYGTLYICQDAANCNHVIKVLQYQNNDSKQRIFNAINIQKLISNHPNAVKFEGYIEADNTVKILTEYCETSLLNEFSRYMNKGLPVEKTIDIFSSILSVIRFMHEQLTPITHRDIRIENVVCRQGTWKLASFSSATTKKYLNFDESSIREAQTDFDININPLNKCPEMFQMVNNMPIDEKVDIWNLGLFLYKLLNFKDAFPGGLSSQINSGTIQWRNNWPIDPFLKSIVEKCLQVDPNARPNIFQLDSEFRSHYGLRETSLAKTVNKAKPLTISQYTAEMVNLPPPFSSELSDESDIEMDEEAEIAKTAVFETVKITNNEFEHLFDWIAEENSESTVSKIDIFDISESSEVHIEYDTISDLEELRMKMYSAEQDELIKILETIQQFHFSAEFILSVCQDTGSKGTQILSLLPDDGHYSQSSQVKNYLMLRKTFACRYPMFEGNFSLHDFTQENKINPPPPGQPPVSIEVINDLLIMISELLNAITELPSTSLVADAFFLYNIACYITAKLIQFRIDCDFVRGEVLSKLSYLHGLLIKTIQNYRVKSYFPRVPFDFSNLEAFIRLRPPKHRNVYENFSNEVKDTV